ncbi:C-GCAxxG-C-C family protein [Anaerofustis sp.]|uniref:C-GCAxxG-C-C family protein n=1 Tax=Anaerofustis sp. TaxID=1872517 RepID=UPI0025BB9EA6|nr:C-GCAxxG-C-C family protein [Anaerofustis sp.]
MGKYGERAVKLHDEKYNCCQSVVLAFCDEIGIEKQELAKLVANLGGGLGYAGEVCGTVSGMAIVSGYLGKWDVPTDQESKKVSYDTIKELVEEFKEKNNYTRCPDLLEQRHSGGTTCSELIGIAADMVAKKMGLE